VSASDESRAPIKNLTRTNTAAHGKDHMNKMPMCQHHVNPWRGPKFWEKWKLFPNSIVLIRQSWWDEGVLQEKYVLKL
jgi:hypothetical protein